MTYSGGEWDIPSAAYVPAPASPAVGDVPTVSGTSPTTYSWGQYVATLGASNGSDDTASINAVLAAVGSASYVKGLSGQAYKISAPLVAKSGTTLDMTGCSVTLNAASNCNMVQNHAVANNAGTASDGAVSSGSNVVTTALGASAVVGQSLVVAGAGSNGNGPLVGIVSAQTSTTITILKLDGVTAANASATVSGATVTLYNRDSDIKVVGGVWNRGSNAGTGTQNHSLMFRHVDGLIVDIDYITSSAGKYGVSLADAARFDINVRDANTFSAGVQVDGPASGGTINLAGITLDDSVAFTCCDWSAYADSSGDIIGVHVGKLSATSTAANLLKYIAGAGNTIDGMTWGNVSGHAHLNGVWIGDDTGQVATIGGSYGTIDGGLIDVVLDQPSIYAPLNLYTPSADRISAKVRYNTTSSSNAVMTSKPGSASATIGKLDVTLDVTGSGCGIYLGAGAGAGLVNTESLIVRGYYNGSGVIVGPATGTITDIEFRGIRADFSATGTGHCCQMQTNSVTVGNVRYVGGSVNQGGDLYYGNGGGTTVVTIAGTYVKASTRIASFYTNGATLVLAGPTFDSIALAAVYVNAATLTIKGHCNTVGTFTMLQRAASEAVSAYGMGLPFDLAMLTRTVGEFCADSSNRIAAGALIPAVCTTTATGGWKSTSGGGTPF